MKTPGILLLVFLVSAVALRADPPVIVHEWGTFTCLQDDKGHAIGGINVDDEPVPSFVYTIGQHSVKALNSNPWTFGLPPYQAFEGKAGILPVDDPAVTMRLETPVLYIYPPKGAPLSSVPKLDVHVEFHGGYLSQYYPYATTGAVDPTANLAAKPATEGDRLGTITSSLDWSNVRVGSNEKPIVTSSKVWTTPRETSAPLLEVHPKMRDVNGVVHDDAQVEHFLFYRGVGHIDSPLFVQVSNMDKKGERTVSAAGLSQLKGFTGWLVDVRGDQTCAFRAINEKGIDISLGTVHFDPSFSVRFGSTDFRKENLEALKFSLHSALVKEGLYDDEATAMLNTWELSYFKNPGLRFFYIVPRAWMDMVLPLTVTGAQTQITRVMVGRIELISYEQTTTLKKLAKGPEIDLNSVRKLAQEAINAGSWPVAEKNAFQSGDRPLNKLGIVLPQPVTDYLSLGRFRDALIVHYNAEHPSDTLKKFIEEYHLGAAN